MKRENVVVKKENVVMKIFGDIKSKKEKTLIEILKMLYMWFLSDLLIYLLMECIVFGPDILLKRIGFSHLDTLARTLTFLLILTLPSLLSNRVIFINILISLPCIILAAVSNFLIEVRGIPFVWTDIYSIQAGFSVANGYVSILDVLSIVVIVVAAITFLYFLYKYVKTEINFNLRAMIFLIMIVIMTVQYNSMIEYNVLDERKNAYVENYQNGLFYAIVDIYKTDTNVEFNKDLVTEAKESLGDMKLSTLEEKPNIIYIQLESIVDPLVFKDFEYSGDPLKNWRELCKQYPNGSLNVPQPMLTAKTEFSAITGLTPEYLGNMNPYMSKNLMEDPIESMAYIMSEYGYEATAIHNFHGSFFDRHLNYPKLGFDRYIPLEMMQNIELVSEKSVKDHVLIDYIDKTLKASKEKDYILAVTMEGHSPYEEELNVGEKFSVTKEDIDENEKIKIEHYLSALSDVDIFIREVVDYVNSLEEHTVVVFYSDHYPHTIFLKEVLELEDNGLLYLAVDNKTPNRLVFPENLNSFEISTYLLRNYGIEGGVINRFQDKYMEDKRYDTIYKAISADIEQDNTIFPRGIKDYAPKDMKIGIDKFNITNIKTNEKNMMIEGNGFNQYSRVYLDDKEVEATVLNENKIEIKEVIDYKTAVVKQVDIYDIELAQTSCYNNY